MLNNKLIRGTFVLTLTGLITRFMGFFFRMFLSHTFGAEQVGLYQLIFPIYGLCFSLSCAGIETSLSRCVAQRISRGQKKQADQLLFQSLTLSLSLSLVLSLFVHQLAPFLSDNILKDSRCEPLLSALVYALPFASIHSCIVGYYLGQRQTKTPAISQLLEQCGRIGTVFIIYKICLNTHSKSTIVIAVIGITFGEILATLYCLRLVPIIPSFRLSLFKELSTLALPLTSNRVLMNILQSIETISIPIYLQKYGYTVEGALSIYGVLTGMALPCIFFPTALTSSISTMLLPTVADIQASEDHNHLNSLIRKVIYFGLCLGGICGIGFFLLGPLIGTLLFNNELVGSFLRTLAWICPFMYMNTTLMSTLNGLGKATKTLFISVCSLAIRISGVWFGIPVFGMQGYLWGLLVSQLIASGLCLWQLLKIK